MTQLTMTRSTLIAGTWETTLEGAGARPEVSVWLGTQALPSVTLADAGPGAWEVRAAVPVECLASGTHVLILRGGRDGTALGHLRLSAGVADAADLAAEVAILRAEVDMLKKALRRIAATSAPDSTGG